MMQLRERVPTRSNLEGILALLLKDCETQRQIHQKTSGRERIVIRTAYIPKSFSFQPAIESTKSGLLIVHGEKNLAQTTVLMTDRKKIMLEYGKTPGLFIKLVRV